MGISKKKLWDVQLREWPNSKRLTVHDMYKWCGAVSKTEQKLSRYMQISMALQYPACVFYYIEGTRYMGFRFGLKGHQYMSLYTGE